MIVLAHIGHWYGVFGFLIPAGLVIAWIRLQARRDRRRQEFAELWLLELRGEDWTLVGIAPAPPEKRRARRTGPQLVAAPWSATVAEPQVPVPGPDGGNGRPTSLRPTPQEGSA